VCPHPRQPREHVLELRQLDLHARFTRACARCENIEDELGAVDHALTRRILDVLPLRGSQLVVEYYDCCVRVADDAAELLDLSLAEIRSGIRAIELLREAADHDSAGCVGELLELVEMLVHDLRARKGRRPGGSISVPAPLRPFDLCPDEDRSLDRGLKLDQFSRDVLTFSAGWSR
jgi:hypothetical protein